MADSQSSNRVLKWAIEAAAKSSDSTSSEPQQAPASRGLRPEDLAELLGGPSNADLMRASIEVVKQPTSESTLEEKVAAFENFEELIAQIDNANNIKPLGLWGDLLAQLSSAEPQLRLWAAWSIGTAVENNIKVQEHLYELKGIGKLVKLVISDRDRKVREKAVKALSREMRNYQPALDEVVEILPAYVWKPTMTRLDAGDMDAVDLLKDALMAYAQSDHRHDSGVVSNASSSSPSPTTLDSGVSLPGSGDAFKEVESVNGTEKESSATVIPDSGVVMQNEWEETS